MRRARCLLGLLVASCFSASSGGPRPDAGAPDADYGSPACSDGQKGGSETDIDCGGPCAPCARDQHCGGDRDCLTGFCLYGVCTIPTCSDGYRNQGETDLDCGGPCDGCDDGAACGLPGDCTSGRCEGSLCTSCRDRVMNGGETAVDCGGPCAPCDVGDVCREPGDCLSGHCEGGRCCAPNACGVCSPAIVEQCNGVDDDCDGLLDQEDPDLGPALCPRQLGVCAGARASCAGAAGWQCGDETYQAWAGAAYEPVETSCDGLDNDCDGVIDQVTCPGTDTVCGTNQCVDGRCQVVPLNEGGVCNAAGYAFCHAGECVLPAAYCSCAGADGQSACTANLSDGSYYAPTCACSGQSMSWTYGDGSASGIACSACVVSTAETTFQVCFQ